MERPLQPPPSPAVDEPHTADDRSGGKKKATAADEPSVVRNERRKETAGAANQGYFAAFLAKASEVTSKSMETSAVARKPGGAGREEPTVTPALPVVKSRTPPAETKPKTADENNNALDFLKTANLNSVVTSAWGIINYFQGPTAPSKSDNPLTAEIKFKLQNEQRIRDLFKLKKGVSRGILEQADPIPNPVTYKTVQMSGTIRVIECQPPLQRVHKKINRSVQDQWRKYGALKKIHEIGGMVSTVEPNADGKGQTRKYHTVKEGEVLNAPPPNIAPILTAKDFDSRLKIKETQLKAIRDKSKDAKSKVK